MSTIAFTNHQGESSSRTEFFSKQILLNALRTIAAVITFVLLFSSPAGAAVQRLTFDSADHSGESADYKGVTEISVAPPFIATVDIFVDGQKLATLPTAPYTVQVDFGNTVVEHRIVVVSRSRDAKKRVEWTRTINRGHSARSVSLRHTVDSQETLEAVVTAAEGDPVSEVEFISGSRVLAKMTQPPYRVTLPADLDSIVYVTARSMSGAEVSDYLAMGDVAVQSYDVRTVPLYVSVVDESGDVRQNLDRSNFRILDNGTEVKILEFGRAANEPISIALLLDGSNSMFDEMGAAQNAALEFVDRVMRPEDRFAVFAIQSSARRLQTLTGDRNLVDNAIRSLSANGDTAIWDTLTAAIRELKGEKNRRAIVILTDGADTSSFTTYEEAVTAARNAGIPIYVIGFGDESDLQESLDRLKYIANESGGMEVAATAKDLQKKYTTIENDLRAQYAIRYQISDESKPNQWRSVKVVLRDPKLTARTIGGYYTP